VIIWDVAPIHRGHVIIELLANGAKQRLHVECLLAYMPELNPGEWLWARLKGVELYHVCCYSLVHLCQELRDAVKRVCRKSRLITGCFEGAKP
jgi:transposase